MERGLSWECLVGGVLKSSNSLNSGTPSEIPSIGENLCLLILKCLVSVSFLMNLLRSRNSSNSLTRFDGQKARPLLSTEVSDSDRT